MVKGLWGRTEQPWLRRVFGGKGKTVCYFCGEKQAILSWGDRSVDPGRLEVYCQNDGCEAREVAVVVLQDGWNSDLRADVRALASVDDPRPVPDRLQAKTVEEIMADDPYLSSDAVYRRRQSSSDLNLHVPSRGELRPDHAVEDADEDGDW